MRIGFDKHPSLSQGAVVVGVRSNRMPTAAFAALDVDGVLSRAMAHTRFDGEFGQAFTVLAPAGLAAGRVLVLGLGDARRFDAGRVRELGGRVASELIFSGARRTSLLLDLDDGQAAELAVGIRLRGALALRKYRTKVEEGERPTLEQVDIACADPTTASRLFARADHGAKAALLARDLVNEPANALTPEALVHRARTLESVGIAVEVLDERALAAQGLNLLLAVGRGSAHPPRLAVLRWMGAAPDAPPLVLVGKGLTFDTGGISIKPAEGMEAMKGDMGGAAAVIGALRAVAGRKAAANVIGVLAIAENMVSGTATRPGDIVRSYAGTTVEIVDTDAEGRLVLADALAWACANLKPKAVVDLATLTGAVVTTLGAHRAGLFANDDGLADRLFAAGEATAEPLWRLPLSQAHDEALKSDAADIRNCAWGRVPDALHAARFLEHFIAPGVAWAHLDIAGVADARDDLPLSPKGATGFGVRLLDRLVMDGFEG